MRTLGFLAFVAMVVGFVGLQRGWWSAAKTSAPDGARIEITVDNERFGKDRDALVRKLQAELARLGTKADEIKQSATANKPKATSETALKEIETLQKDLKGSIDEVKTASADNWTNVRSRSERAWDRIQVGFKKAAGELKR